MKRKVITALFIIAFFLLQSTVFQKLEFASIAPNLMIILTSSFGFMRGKKEGMLVGFFSGLLMDIFYGIGQIIGFYALIYLLIGYANGFFKRLFFEEDIRLPIGLIFGSELLYGLINYIAFYMMRSKFDFKYYLNHIIFPELVYTIVVTLAVYPLILAVNRRLEDEEKRSANKFV
ncbi:MAG TPA: rod shape-determining protein MreD [Lachnospiraceae bacterium]|nr:rod shape-determining protein MreD [Lachnospiraceae bacterium]